MPLYKFFLLFVQEVNPTGDIIDLSREEPVAENFLVIQLEDVKVFSVFHGECILRSIIERALEVHKGVYRNFIDATKSVDRTRHDEIITELTELEIDGKDLRVLKNVYGRQTAAIQVGGEIRCLV